jgi:hypothetical protein
VKPEEIGKWIGLIRLWQHEREIKQPNWERNLEAFKGLTWQQDREANKDIITVNLVYSHVKVEIPSIYFRNPKIFMKATKPSAVYRARIQETVLTQDLEIMDLKSEMRKMILDVILFGSAFSKTTYYIDYNPKEEQPGDRGNILDLVQKFEGNPIQSVEGDGEVELGENGPQVVRWSPFNIAMRQGVTDIRDPGFIAFKSLLFTDDIKNDKYFKNTKDLVPTIELTEATQAKLGNYYNREVGDCAGMNAVWEIWDVEKGKKFVIAEGHEEALREPEDNAYPYDHPGDLLKFTDIPDELLGMSEVDPYFPQLEEYNLHRTLHLQHTRKYTGRKTIVKRGVINTEEDKERLKSGDDAVVEVDGNVADVAILPDAQMSADTYRFIGAVKDEITELSGITPYKRGMLQGADTATEANIAETNSQTRDSDRVDVIQGFVKRILRKVRLCRKEFTPGEYIVQVTGDPKAGPLWEVWSKEMFTDDTILDIQYGSTQPINSQTRKSEALGLYQVLIQNPTINPQSAAAKLLEAYDETDIPSWFLPPEILAQQMLAKITGEQTENQEIKGVAPTAKGGSQQAPAGGGRKPGETPAETGGNPLQAGVSR